MAYSTEKLHHSEDVPKIMSLQLLNEITNNFSEERKLGSGTYGIVYKGEQNGEEIAVKMLRRTEKPDDGENFKGEFENLSRLRHQNIVRLLGYCYETKAEYIVIGSGKAVVAQKFYRALCFEYMHNGSLQKHLYDENHGHDWQTRYKIIKGICEGLKYLHEGFENPIYHLDLKPDNILLDKNMVPKLADFGLARLVRDKQTHATRSALGTIGYCPPEYITGDLLSIKFDIFSLGVVMIRIITGYDGYHKIADMSSLQFIDLVHENWRNRLQTTPGCTSLEAECHQVKRCIEIALDCVQADRHKRPKIGDIIHWLNETENMDLSAAPSPLQRIISVPQGPGETSTEASSSVSELVDEDELQPMAVSAAPSPLQRIVSVPKRLGETSTEFRLGSSEMLDIHPLELRFPWEPYKSINCPVTLTNRTDRYVGVWIKPTCPQTHSDIRFPVLWGNKSLKDPSSSVFQEMGPNITLVVAMTLEEEQQPPLQDTGKFEVLMIVMGSEKDLKNLGPPYGRKRNMDNDYLKRVEELGGEVHRAILKAVICDPASCQEVIRNLQFIPALSMFGDVKAIDVHPTKAWILIVHGQKCVSIWNYQTQEPVMVLQVTKTERMLFFTHSTTQCKVSSAKFIAQKQWIVTGGSDGWIHVYADATKVKVKEFEAYPGTSGVSSLAVHPNHPFLLTSSNFDNTIKLWDWHQGWKCTRKFDNGPSKGINIMWIPRDYADRTFVSATLGNVKIWEIHSTDPITTFKGWYHGCCLYSDSHRNFLVIGSDFSPIPLPHVRGAQIWDMQTKKHVHTLNLTNYPVISDVVACHPKLQILASVSDSFVCLWDARTYRLEQIVELPSRPVKGMAFIDTWGLTRLVVGCEKNIAIMEINLPTLETDLQTGGAN